jgi:hypothetical protein
MQRKKSVEVQSEDYGGAAEGEEAEKAQSN